MSTAQSARDFFTLKNELTSEHILVEMDIKNMMILRKFGHRMLIEAQNNNDELMIHGNASQMVRMAIQKDMDVISTNLNKLEVAYKLAMN